MNNKERVLLYYIVEDNMRMAKKQARLILEGLTSQTDSKMKEDYLRRLDATTSFMNLPENVKSFLIAEDSSAFPTERFLLRADEELIVNRILNLYKVSGKLANMGIPYLPALMLHGESGTGKTMLARYIAYKADLPFLYVRFSNLVNSHLGSTQSNVSKVFDYARNEPCVLCFDEIDAIGMARGQKDDVGEMNRVVIALMQELDSLRNDIIIIGTTNRYDMLDSALIRRFHLAHEVKKLNYMDCIELAHKFLSYAKFDDMSRAKELLAQHIDGAPASTIIKECTDLIVSDLIAKEDFDNPAKK